MTGNPNGTSKNSMLGSKKAKAYLLAEVSWKVLLGASLGVLQWQINAGQTPSPMFIWFMIVIVIVAGFIEVGFIGGQAWLDKYVYVAQIAANGAPKGGAPTTPTTPPVITEPTNDTPTTPPSMGGEAPEL